MVDENVHDQQPRWRLRRRQPRRWISFKFTPYLNSAHHLIAPRMAVAAPTSFGFKNLMETIMVNVHRAEIRPLNVPLLAPFSIATSRLEKVENVAIRIELRNGYVGWAEAPILPFVMAEDQRTAIWDQAAMAAQGNRHGGGKLTVAVLLAGGRKRSSRQRARAGLQSP